MFVCLLIFTLMKYQLNICMRLLWLHIARKKVL